MQSDRIGILYDMSSPGLLVAMKIGLPFSRGSGYDMYRTNHLYGYSDQNSNYNIDNFGLRNFTIPRPLPRRGTPGFRQDLHEALENLDTPNPDRYTFRVCIDSSCPGDPQSCDISEARSSIGHDARARRVGCKCTKWKYL